MVRLEHRGHPLSSLPRPGTQGQVSRVPLGEHHMRTPSHETLTCPASLCLGSLLLGHPKDHLCVQDPLTAHSGHRRASEHLLPVGSGGIHPCLQEMGEGLALARWFIVVFRAHPEGTICSMYGAAARARLLLLPTDYKKATSLAAAQGTRKQCGVSHGCVTAVGTGREEALPHIGAPQSDGGPGVLPQPPWGEHGVGGGLLCSAPSPLPCLLTHSGRCSREGAPQA